MAADIMEICQSPSNCDRVLMRFLVKPNENSPKNAAFTNTALIWDNKTGNAGAYKTNQGLSVRSTFASSCEPLDDAAVKAQLYTKESMSCEGTKEVPDDSGTSSDDTSDSDDSSDDTGSTDGGKDEENDSSSGLDDEDDSGCSIVVL